MFITLTNKYMDSKVVKEHTLKYKTKYEYLQIQNKSSPKQNYKTRLVVDTCVVMSHRPWP